jgi:hypothetical protein
MDYAEKYNAMRDLSVDSDTLLEWKKDPLFLEWLRLRDGPVTIDGYIVERTGARSATITDPNGFILENIVFSSDTPDTLDGMLNWHRFGPS